MKLNKNREPIENLLAAVSGVEQQEARGQQTMINSQVLPQQWDTGDIKKLKALGVKFLKPANDLFFNVILPEGWVIKPTSHSMWSDLKDDKGSVVANIFYKAAFYDEKAHGHLA